MEWATGLGGIILIWGSEFIYADIKGNVENACFNKIVFYYSAFVHDNCNFPLEIIKIYRIYESF